MIGKFNKKYLSFFEDKEIEDIYNSKNLTNETYSVILERMYKLHPERAEELMKSLETHTPLAKDKVAHSIKLIEATKDYAVKRKNYEASLEAKKDTDKAVKMLEKKYKESLKN